MGRGGRDGLLRRRSAQAQPAESGGGDPSRDQVAPVADLGICQGGEQHTRAGGAEPNERAPSRVQVVDGGEGSRARAWLSSVQVSPRYTRPWV